MSKFLCPICNLQTTLRWTRQLRRNRTCAAGHKTITIETIESTGQPARCHSGINLIPIGESKWFPYTALDKQSFRNRMYKLCNYWNSHHGLKLRVKSFTTGMRVHNLRND